MTVKITFLNCTGEALTRDGQQGAVAWFPATVADDGTATGEGASDGWLAYKGDSGSVRIQWQTSGDGSVTATASGYPTDCNQGSDGWSVSAHPAPAVPHDVQAAPNQTATVDPSDCLCATGASDRDCLLALIAKILSPEGKMITLPGFASDGHNSSCGDTTTWFLHQWGSKENAYFMVDAPERPGQGSMPKPGDIFVLQASKPVDGEPTCRRAHVGFVYRIRGDATNFEWQSAEGGQEHISVGAAGQMWINPNWRGIKGTNTDLFGWRSLDSFHRDRTKCKGKPGRK